MWYYADMEKKKCNTATVPVNGTMPDPDACVVWRRFAKSVYFNIDLFYEYSLKLTRVSVRLSSAGAHPLNWISVSIAIQRKTGQSAR